MIVIWRAFACPSFANTMLIPTLRRNEAARRNRPDRARPLRGQASDLATRSSTRPASWVRRSEDVPFRITFAPGGYPAIRPAISDLTATATGLASSTLSTAPKMLAS